MTHLEYSSLFLSKNVRCLYRGAGYKNSIGIKSSAWKMFRVDEVKPQNLTYKNPQLYKDYNTFQTHSYLSPSIWKQKLKNKTKCLWLSGSGSHRKAGKDWIPQLWSPILSLLDKNFSLLLHAVGLPEGNTSTGGQKGRARKALQLHLQTTEAGFSGSSGLWYFMQQKWGGKGRSKVFHWPGQKSHIILHPGFLTLMQRYRNKNICVN